MTMQTVGFTCNLKDAGTPVDSTAFAAYTSGGSISLTSSADGVASCSNNLFDTGAYNTISWGAVTGAERYYVYKKSNGLFGYIGQTQGLSFTDDNIAATIAQTPPLLDNPFWSAGNYPTGIAYYEQRRCFGGTTFRPARFWATRSATESNLSYSIPGRDDDAIVFTIASRDRQAIKHIVPMANLILLTESGEWRVAPADGAVLTPDVSVRQQSAIGSGDAAPLVINNNLLFAAARGGHIRELAYNFQANGYITGDVSLRAPHLFDGFDIVDMAYAKAPVPIAWFVSTSGKLLGLTYVPEQEVGAWHVHDTLGGTFESVCVVPEGADDVVYVTVLRGGKRYVERMAPRVEDLADGFFVDSGVSQTFGSPVSTVTGGVDHLIGKVVAIVADGAVLAQRVAAYPIVLDAPASKVTIGLPIEADIETLPLAMQVDGFGQGRPKNVNEVWLRTYNASGFKAGPRFDRMVEQKPRSDEPYGAPPRLGTGEVRIAVPASWTSGGTLCARHDAPTPATIVSLTLGFAVGG